MESALYGVYTLAVLYQKSHSFASLTRSISDTPQLVCKHRTHALSMKYSICICRVWFGAGEMYKMVRCYSIPLDKVKEQLFMFGSQPILICLFVSFILHALLTLLPVMFA